MDHSFALPSDHPLAQIPPAAVTRPTIRRRSAQEVQERVEERQRRYHEKTQRRQEKEQTREGGMRRPLWPNMIKTTLA